MPSSSPLLSDSLNQVAIREWFHSRHSASIHLRMEQLIHAFGIDVKLITVQIVNFAILAAALTYFLYNPVLNLLQKREEKIAQGLEDAEAAAKAKAAAAEEKTTILSAANAEAEAMQARAKAHADEKAEAIVSSAISKAEQVLKDAEAEREHLKAQAKKESEAEVAKTAMLAAEKILREKTS